MSGARILIVEDEEPLRMALADALRAEGFVVSEAGDGETGLALALREAPDVVLLDLMLPGRDGFSVLRAIREDRLAVAVVILSARGEEWDRVQGFEYGADDYVVKPFSVRELLLRLHAVLRRAEGAVPGLDSAAGPGRVRIGDVVVDFAGYSLQRGAAPGEARGPGAGEARGAGGLDRAGRTRAAGGSAERIGLSRLELELLRYFLQHEGRTLDRATLLNDVWGNDEYPTTRTVDMHVLKLRRKLEADPERPRHLLTVHGVGYRFSRRGEGP